MAHGFLEKVMEMIPGQATVVAMLLLTAVMNLADVFSTN